MNQAHIAIGAIALLLLGGAGDADPVNRGLAAFQSGQFAEAWQSWQQASAAGDARGALYVGVLYDAGLGVPPEKRQALEWYRRAAEQGSAAGAFNVGVLYDAGLGVPVNQAEAAAWYSRAAEDGYGRAEYNLGMLYEEGTGIPRDRTKAIALFQSAAAHGVPAAQLHLSRLQPAVTPVSKRSQRPHAQDHAMQDFQQAQQLLLARGAAEAARAASLFRRAAEQHNPLAAYDLGYCYERGLGVPRDPVQADYWYRRALADAPDGAVRSLAQAGIRNMEDQVRQAQLATPRTSR